MFLEARSVPYKNKEDQIKASRRHYENNKEYYKKRALESKQRVRARWEEFKSTLKCINCGFSHPAALDFHHVVQSPDNQKVHTLLYNQAYNKAMEEIKKCVPLCANCHRIHHYDEHKARKAKKERKRKKSSRRN